MIDLLKKMFSIASKDSNKSSSKSGTLAERHRETITNHYNKIRYSATYSSHNSIYNVDNMVRDCINEIAELEGERKLAPMSRYLSRWESYAPEKYKKLVREIKPLFDKRYQELRDAYYQKEEEDRECKGKNLYNRNIDLIQKFFVIAYRKVTTVDVYGDENWEAFKKELTTVLFKIAERENVGLSIIKDIKKGKYWHRPEYESLKCQIEAAFRAYYEKEKLAPLIADNYKNLNGTEFENYLMNIFKQKGYEVSGTPSTGDQGADLIITMRGKKIAIQAKKYTGAVGNKAIQEVVSAKTYYGCDEAWVITNSRFTKSASDLAQKCAVKLIDGDLLSRLYDDI